VVRDSKANGIGKPKALLLDWEGTLAFNPQPHDEVQRRIARGLAREMAQDARLRGLDRDEVWRRYRDRLRTATGASGEGHQPEPAVALGKALREHGANLSDEEVGRLSRDSYVGDPELGVRLFDETAGALQRARRMEVKLGLVSNREFGLDLFAADLAQLGVADYFDAVVISADVGFAKPHPEPFRTAMRKLAVVAGEAVMAGNDPVADVGGAKALGLGRNRGRLLESDARLTPLCHARRQRYPA
jgi:FMN phosphatase YigB (HAD superfamily)